MFNELRRNLMAFIYAQKLEWKSAIFYRLQSVLWLISSISNILLSIILITVIYSFSNGFAGWSYYQMLLLVGLANISDFTVQYFIILHNLIRSMREGGLDSILTKPINPLLFILSKFGFVQGGMGGAVSGVVLVIYALTQLHVTLAGMSYFIILLILSLSCIVLFALSFGLILYILFKSGSFADWFISNISFAAGYPLNIFGRTGTLILTLLLPIGLATFYPAELLFEKISNISGLWVILLEVALIYIFYNFSTWALRTQYTSGGG